MLKNIRSKSRVGADQGEMERDREMERRPPLISAYAMGLYNSSVLKYRDIAKPWRLLPCFVLVTSRVPETSREAGDSKCYGIHGLTLYLSFSSVAMSGNEALRLTIAGTWKGIPEGL